MPEINEQKHPREVSEGLPEQVIDNTSLLYKYPGRKKIANMYLMLSSEN